MEPTAIHISDKPKSLKRQAGAFGVVGIINTLLDFSILNIGAFLFGLPIILANIISTSTALSFSYFANKKWVFNDNRAPLGKKSLALFIAITLIGLYGLQSIIIYTLTAWATLPLEIAVTIARGLGITAFTDGFIAANTAKLIATIATTVWNFVLYKKFVFKG